MEWTDMMHYQQQMQKVIRALLPLRKSALTASECELLAHLYLKPEAVSRCLKSLYEKTAYARKSRPKTSAATSCSSQKPAWRNCGRATKAFCSPSMICGEAPAKILKRLCTMRINLLHRLRKDRKTPMMKFYDALQLDPSILKRKIAACDTKKEKIYYWTAIAVRSALIVGFAIVFISLLSQVFGADNTP